MLQRQNNQNLKPTKDFRHLFKNSDIRNSKLLLSVHNKNCNNKEMKQYIDMIKSLLTKL